MKLPSIKLTENDNKIINNLLIDEFITINNGDFRGRGNKCWPTVRWKELVKKIEKIGLSTVQLGVERDEFIEGSYDLRGKTTIYEAAAAMKRGLFHIDTEGGMVFLAKAVGKRSIVLFGPTYKEFFGLEDDVAIDDGGAEGLRTTDPQLAKPITRHLVVKPHLPSYEDAIKAYKAVVR